MMSFLTESLIGISFYMNVNTYESVSDSVAQMVKALVMYAEGTRVNSPSDHAIFFLHIDFTFLFLFFSKYK